jgi:chromate transporter
MRLGELFAVAVRIGLFSFGGGLAAWMHHEFVVKRAWMDERSFYVDQAIARIMPGTNVSNFMVVGGFRMGGLLASIVGTVGVLVGPFFLITAAAVFYDRFAGPLLSDLLDGAGAAALGLIVPVVVRGIRQTGRSWNGAVVVGTVVVGVGLFGAPMAAFIVFALPLSIALVLLRRKQHAR